MFRLLSIFFFVIFFLFRIRNKDRRIQAFYIHVLSWVQQICAVVDGTEIVSSDQNRYNDFQFD